MKFKVLLLPLSSDLSKINKLTQKVVVVVVEANVIQCYTKSILMYNFPAGAKRHKTEMVLFIIF